ncbi:MAG: hypothetical protein U0V70_18440 [Terriglobia bacterium]
MVKIGDHTYCHACSRQKADEKPKLEGQGLPVPAAAFWLGLIPGVGAIYNGEYYKAFVNVMIFGFLITLGKRDSSEGLDTLIHLLTAAFYFYMPLEAYHTAKRRRLEASGLLVETGKETEERFFGWSGTYRHGAPAFHRSVCFRFPGSSIEVLAPVPGRIRGYKIWEHFQRRGAAERSQ